MSCDPYNEGYEWALEAKGSHVDDNPYEEWSKEWIEWNNGFHLGTSHNRYEKSG